MRQGRLKISFIPNGIFVINGKKCDNLQLTTKLERNVIDFMYTIDTEGEIHGGRFTRGAGRYIIVFVPIILFYFSE